MTRYEQGYMKKCAEYGLDGRWVYKAAAGVNGVPGVVGNNVSSNGVNNVATPTVPVTGETPYGIGKGGITNGLPKDPDWFKRNLPATPKDVPEADGTKSGLRRVIDAYRNYKRNFIRRVSEIPNQQPVDKRRARYWM